MYIMFYVMFSIYSLYNAFKFMKNTRQFLTLLAFQVEWTNRTTHTVHYKCSTHITCEHTHLL